MQSQERNRRNSILKKDKRRSRSLSPTSSPKEKTIRRASRRISFSSKNTVREFTEEKNKGTVWCDYEQLTLHSTQSSSESSNLLTSTTLQKTKNESITMDCSNLVLRTSHNKTKNESTAMECSIVSTRINRPLIRSSAINDQYGDQKENILVNNSDDMELTMLGEQQNPISKVEKSLIQSNDMELTIVEDEPQHIEVNNSMIQSNVPTTLSIFRNVYDKNNKENSLDLSEMSIDQLMLSRKDDMNNTPYPSNAHSIYKSMNLSETVVDIPESPQKRQNDIVNNKPIEINDLTADSIEMEPKSITMNAIQQDHSMEEENFMNKNELPRRLICSVDMPVVNLTNRKGSQRETIYFDDPIADSLEIETKSITTNATQKNQSIEESVVDPTYKKRPQRATILYNNDPITDSVEIETNSIIVNATQKNQSMEEENFTDEIEPPHKTINMSVVDPTYKKRPQRATILYNDSITNSIEIETNSITVNVTQKNQSMEEENFTDDIEPLHKTINMCIVDPSYKKKSQRETIHSNDSVEIETKSITMNATQKDQSMEEENFTNKNELLRKSANMFVVDQPNKKKSQRETIYYNNSISVSSDSAEFEHVKLDSVHYLTAMEQSQIDSPTLNKFDSNVNSSKINDEPQQLTFIDMDDEEMDLVSSINLSQTFEELRRNSISLRNSPAMNVSNVDAAKVLDSDPILKLEKQEAFKPSNLLRRSIISNLALPNQSIENVQQEQQQQITHAPNTIQDLDETSFLMRPIDKPLSELNIDLSGYDRFEGLSTPQDVLSNFQQKLSEIQRKKEKMENNEPLVDADDENEESQNVPAPSWTFLWENKCKYEDEQLKAEWDRRRENRSIGAQFPQDGEVQLLTLNKCRQLKHWDFEEEWYFQGNIYLRNKIMPEFKVVLLYDEDNNSILDNLNQYEALKFIKIMPQFCPYHLERKSPLMHLSIQELKSKLPKNLLSLCVTSTELSDFDEKLNNFCADAYEKAKYIHDLCNRHRALLKMENGRIYIKKKLFDFVRFLATDYIIDLDDIDRTEWRNVKTNPNRALHDDVKTLPIGVPFIEEFVLNGDKYVPME